MVTYTQSYCHICKYFEDRYHGNMENWARHDFACAAFPGGIPENIFFEGVKHDKPLESQDNDLVFESIPEEDKSHAEKEYFPLPY